MELLSNILVIFPINLGHIFSIYKSFELIYRDTVPLKNSHVVAYFHLAIPRLGYLFACTSDG